MNKIYIAGKITGLEDYKDRFEVAEIQLIKLGFVCLNPVRLPKGFEHKEYIHICFSMIDVCDCVYMLNNWKDSPGARAEHEYALRKHKKIIYEEIQKGVV